MAPLPKRKHSTQRKGKRMKTRVIPISQLTVCRYCGKPKLPHRLCQFCQK